MMTAVERALSQRSVLPSRPRKPGLRVLAPAGALACHGAQDGGQSASLFAGRHASGVSRARSEQRIKLACAPLNHLPQVSTHGLAGKQETR